MTRSLKLIVALGALLVAGAADAGSLRCGGALITSGDASLRVLAKCGEPAAREQYVIYRTVSGYYQAPQGRHFSYRSGNTWIRSERTRPNSGHYAYGESGTIAVPVEVWTYNLGPNRFMRQLRIEGGVVKSLETLGYGY